jgi:hypothetical protein
MNTRSSSIYVGPFPFLFPLFIEVIVSPVTPLDLTAESYQAI